MGSNFKETSALDTVEIGKVVGMHGNGGELRIFPYGDEIESWDLRELTLASSDGSSESFSVLEVRPHKRVILFKLKAVNSKEKAEALRGRVVTIKRGDLPEALPGEYYHFELEGLKVVTEEGAELGRLTKIITTGANDVYEVTGGERELLLPAIEDVIVDVDTKGGIMTVSLMDGMLPDENDKKGSGK